MTDDASGSGHRARRVISYLVDTGPAGDADWRWSRRTTLALLGPGSVPLAVLLFGADCLMLAGDWGAWLTPLVALVNPAAIMMARYRPLWAWLLTLVFLAVSAGLISTVSALIWPWTVSGVVALTAIQFAVARDRGIGAAVAVWALDLGIGAYLTFLWEVTAARQNPFLIALLTAVATALGLSARAVRRARHRVSEEEQLTAAERFRRSLLEERARIARELHDVVAHHMSVISVQASTAEYRLTGLSPVVRGEFDSIAQQARESLAELRRLLAVLRGDDETASTAPLPDLDRLSVLVESASRAGVEATLTREGIAEPPDAVGLTAYRIVQEALSNVVRHAPGADTRITVAGAETGLSVTVANDAVDRTGPEAAGAGLGLTGLRERVALLDGEFSADAAADGGFTVRAWLPYPGRTVRQEAPQ